MKTKLFHLAVIVFCVLLSSCVTRSLESRVDDAGKKMTAAFVAGDTGDTWNLRSDADYSVQLGRGVWWVPANGLGRSCYTNSQIAAVVNEDPDVKKELIGNVYEAAQLFQISDFAYDGSEDRLIADVKDPESGIVWEKHSPGYWSLALNRGNSSTCASWLGYILDGDYEKSGYLLFRWPDGNSHVMNWFLHDGYYYFIDMTHFQNDYDTRYRGIEDGDISSYRKSDTLLSNIHKTESFEDYVSYLFFALLHSDNTSPSLIFSIEGTEVPDLDSIPPEKYQW